MERLLTRQWMAKKWLLGLLVALVASFYFISPAWARLEKVGYVDVAKVFDDYQKTKDNETSLQAVGKKKEEEREVLVHDIRRLKDEQALLAEDARDKKQEAIDTKIRDLQQFDMVARKELLDVRNTKVKELSKDIEAVVQSYGQRKGFDFILDDRLVLYHNAKFDVTRDILDELNRSYQTKKK